MITWITEYYFGKKYHLVR